MTVDNETAGKKLNDIMKEQAALVDRIYAEQQHMRSGVSERSWENVENARYRLDGLTAEFSRLEKARGVRVLSLSGTSGGNLYEVTRLFSPELKAAVHETYRELRKKLLLSKIENDALNTYIGTAKKFLCEVFDTVLPQRRGRIYSKRGGMVRQEPESLVIDRSL